MSLTQRNGCGTLRADDAGEAVDLYGWVHRRRDHGGLIFIDLRDRTGIVQVTFDPSRGKAHAAAEERRLEYVVNSRGVVRRRPAGAEIRELETGQIEVVAED